MMNEIKPDNLSCPIPKSDYPQVMLAHGGGGTLMAQLIENVFRQTFSNDHLNHQTDSSVIGIGKTRLAFTTDSFVIQPLFFPGGNIGSLAVHGTVNDLAMSGARPLYLSAGYILEEGFPLESLREIARAMQAAAREAGVQIITGDTKVVDRGHGDGVFINTSGIGVIEHSLIIAPQSVRPGDAILLNGDVGRHGIAVLASREGLEFDCGLESDSAALNGLVQALLDDGVEIHCMRDCTRGGAASALNEIADSAGYAISIEEARVPVLEEVAGACEMLGFDPLYVANEGRFIAFVPEAQSERALEIMKAHPLGESAAIIGAVTDGKKSRVTMKSKIGAARILDRLSGEQLPRIC